MKDEMEILKFLADICVKTFQIVFGMLVVGMFLREKFNGLVFVVGLLGSSLMLTLAIILYYNGIAKEEE